MNKLLHIGYTKLQQDYNTQEFCNNTSNLYVLWHYFLLVASGEVAVN